ncbi:MAG: UDP-N-acetylmuramate--L-alanine ligase, partial [Candidatus Stygibacter australis]|nr:UDP-N-acetylmuramate--L-alanine ligase [Candidatus Stygibacter australis]
MFGKMRKIHFVGIGGIGMSGIAELLSNQGFIISGSDLRESSVTEHLRTKNIRINIGHDPQNIWDADVVVKSSAVVDENPEIASAIHRKIPVIRRAEMLAEIMRMSYGVCIAGTHGKTSTTSMVGTVFEAAGLDPTVIVGGIVKNYGSNNLLGSGKYIIAEADEFDRSFLSLYPCIAGITNIDADHLDCYKDIDNIKSAFTEFANKVPFFGSVICCLDDKGVQSVIPDIKKNIFTYGFSAQATLRAINIEMSNFETSYTAILDNQNLGQIHLKVPGKHNVLNSLLAVSVGLELQIPFSAIQTGLAGYNGVFRRFEYKGNVNDITLYDDYCHHPTEIIATLNAIKENTDRRIVAVFQPHLYSRTRDFYNEFGRSFFQSDILLVAPIFPAREKPIPGISGKMIADAAIQSGHRHVHYIESNDEIVKSMKSHCQPGDIIVTMGAGNIYQYGEEFLRNV